jgi:glycosyltransferase involved in cell wall biosynthesis
MDQLRDQAIIRLVRRQIAKIAYQLSHIGHAADRLYSNIWNREQLLDAAAQIANSEFFDESWYLEQYPDVARAHINPAIHYLQFGANEGRNPSLLFNSTWYLTQYPDVARAGINPLLHFLYSGRREGRQPQPSAPQPLISTCQRPDASAKSQANERENPCAESTANLDWHRAQQRSSPRQNILFVSHDAAPAGSQLLLLELIKHFIQLPEFDCYILLCQGGLLENQFKQLAKTWNLQQLLATDISHEEAIGLILSDIHAPPDTIAFCNTVVTANLVKLFAHANIPVVGYIHELPTSIESYVGRSRFLEFVNHAKLMIVVSDFVSRALSSYYQVDPSRFVSLHAGVKGGGQNFDSLKETRDHIIRELDLPTDTCLILGCGSVHPRKGTDLFVQVAKKVYAKPGMDHVRFIWIGADQDGPTFRSWCEHDIQTTGMSSKVLLIGGKPVSTVQQYFATADIFLLTSREDPFPLVNLEAMSHSLPIVAFKDAGGAPEALIPDAGLVVPYLDVDMMAEQVITLINDKALRQTLGNSAHEKYKSQYQWSRYTRDIVRLLQKSFDTAKASTKADR